MSTTESWTEPLLPSTEKNRRYSIFYSTAPVYAYNIPSKGGYLSSSGARFLGLSPSFIPPGNHSSIANGWSVREILGFQNTHFVYSFEVQEFESKRDSNILLGEHSCLQRIDPRSTE